MKNDYLHFQSIFVDSEELNLPVAIFNENKSKTILITAGVDGDEYSGIKAAYNLIHKLEKIKTNYRIIVIPVVNVFGNKEGVSYNPRDKKYPKYIYPGKLKGSSSEQLIFYLDKYIQQSFLWIDLHSGAKDEMLKPFIWTWETKSKMVNEFVLDILSLFPEDKIIYQQGSQRKTEELAKKNIAYLMLESGELGLENTADIEKHLNWISKILSGKSKREAINVYRKVQFHKAPRSGSWRPKLNPGKISKTQVVGLCGDKEIFCKEDNLLYQKKATTVKKGDEIFATAYELRSI